MKAVGEVAGELFFILHFILLTRFVSSNDTLRPGWPVLLYPFYKLHVHEQVFDYCYNNGVQGAGKDG